MKKRLKPKTITNQKLSQIKKDFKIIKNTISKSKWKKDKTLTKTKKEIDKIIKNKKIDYYNTVRTDLNNIKGKTNSKLVFTTNKEKNDLLSKVKTIQKTTIPNYGSSKKITKKQKTQLNKLAKSVFNIVNSKKIQAHNPVTIETTGPNGNKIVTKWTNLVTDNSKKTTSKIYAKYMAKKSINVTSWTSYHYLVNNDPESLQIYTQPFMTVEGSKIIWVNDTYKWIELSTSKLKNDYKWYYQENRTYNYYLGTKTVYTYNNGKLINSIKHDGQSYLDTITKKLRDDWSMYVLPSEFCESNNSAIINLANEIKKNVSVKTDVNLANAVLSWVHNNIEYELYGDTKYGAIETLNVKKGNCNDQAHLVVALLRALNIPAKYKANQREGSTGTEGHAWTYAYMILPKTFIVNGNAVYTIINNDEYITDHVDCWWCGQTTDGDGKKLGYHWTIYEWCTSQAVIGSYLDSFNCGSSKLEFINGTWYALTQKLTINGQNVTVWSL